MEKFVILFDGNNCAYRSNCTTELYTSAGERTSAIKGVLESVKHDIDFLTNSYAFYSLVDVIVIWDGGRSKERKALYPEYKCNRDSNNKKTEEAKEEKALWMQEFYQQVAYLESALPSFGVKSFKVKGWEADDIIYAITQELIS